MDRYLVVESVEGGVAEVELEGGLRTEVPVGWLPRGAEEGVGYRIEPVDGGVRFELDEAAVRVVRERNKQTLLDFSDEVE